MRGFLDILRHMDILSTKAYASFTVVVPAVLPGVFILSEIQGLPHARNYLQMQPCSFTVALRKGLKCLCLPESSFLFFFFLRVPFFPDSYLGFIMPFGLIKQKYYLGQGSFEAQTVPLDV